MQTPNYDIYKFCQHCGSNLYFVRNNLYQCKNLHHIYINPKTTNGAILENEKGEVLLVKRKVSPHKGMWDVPGGFVDLNETLEESIKRELSEELGLTINDLKYINSKVDTYRYQGFDYPTLCTYFSGTIKSDDKISASSDIDGFAFFNKKNIPYKKIAFVNLKEFLKEYTNKKT